jgi:hypothetical protein
MLLQGPKRFGAVAVVNGTALELRLEFSLDEESARGSWALAAVLAPAAGLPHGCVYLPLGARVRLTALSGEPLVEGVVGPCRLELAAEA